MCQYRGNSVGMLLSFHQYSSGCGVIQQATDNTDDPDFLLLPDPQYFVTYVGRRLESVDLSAVSLH